MKVDTKQDRRVVPSSPYTLKATDINQIVAELEYIIGLAELVPSSEDTTQLFEALQILLATVNSTQVLDDNGIDIKTQAERNRAYEAAISGGVTLAYPECYLCGGLLTYNTNVIVDIAASKSRSSDNTKNIDVAGASLDITTNANWASGTAPSLVSATIYVWATYHATTPKYLFDNVTGSNITAEKRLVAKLKTDSSSHIINATMIDFSMDTTSAMRRTSIDLTTEVSKNNDTDYVAETDLWAFMVSNPGTAVNWGIKITVGNVYDFATMNINNADNTRIPFQTRIPKGATYRFQKCDVIKVYKLLGEIS